MINIFHLHFVPSQQANLTSTVNINFIAVPNLQIQWAFLPKRDLFVPQKVAKHIFVYLWKGYAQPMDYLLFNPIQNLQLVFLLKYYWVPIISIYIFANHG